DFLVRQLAQYEPGKPAIAEPGGRMVCSSDRWALDSGSTAPDPVLPLRPRAVGDLGHLAHDRATARRGPDAPDRGPPGTSLPVRGRVTVGSIRVLRWPDHRDGRARTCGPVLSRPGSAYPCGPPG